MLRHRHHFSPLRFSVREEKSVQVDLEFFPSKFFAWRSIWRDFDGSLN
jgi:hypothetical protein